MSKRLVLSIPDEFYDEIAALKPVHQTISVFCVDLIAQGVDRLFRLATCPAGAGKVEQSPSEETSVQEAVVPVQENFSTPLHGGLGGGVGKGSGETPRSTPCKRKKREIPEELKQHETLILEFWRVKNGARSDTAWSMLITNLIKILHHSSHQVVQEQLEAACNGKWKGITYANFERYRPKQQDKEPTPLHPASRVYTADKGFEGESDGFLSYLAG
mgnify:CR=1 FL=1